MFSLRHVAILLVTAGLCQSAVLLRGRGQPESAGNVGYSTLVGFGLSPWSFGVSNATHDSCLVVKSRPGFSQDTANLGQAFLSKRDNQTLDATRTISRADDSADAPIDARPTPQPTGTSSTVTTVHITNATDFALLLPSTRGELISDAESDGVAFCSSGSSEPTCMDRPKLPEGFIRAAAITEADDGSWIQVTGCIDSAKSGLDTSDEGGQFDVRFPNGAQCTFGGYGASFIEQVEPASSRFCLRCCASVNDQKHCNSHQDRAGCTVAIPGQYHFPQLGVSCA